MGKSLGEWVLSDATLRSTTRNPHLDPDNRRRIAETVDPLGEDERWIAHLAEAEQIVAPYDQGLDAWIAEEGFSVYGSYSFPPHTMMIAGGRHIALSRLRWQVVTFVPLVLANIEMGRGVGPTDFHGLLARLTEVVTRLDAPSIAVLHRVREQGRGLGGASRETLAVGVSRTDRELLSAVVDELVAAEVLREGVDGVLSVVW